MNEEANSLVAPKSAAWRFGIYFLVATIVSMGVLLALFHQRLLLERAQLVNEESLRIALAVETMQRDLDVAVNDLRRTANARAMQDYLANGDAAAKRRLIGSFLNLARFAQMYDQIRYLDVRGREKIRINHRGVAPASVDSAALQDKSDRYYFRAANTLGAGQVYVSPLDLNMERGVVERPFKPMIRLAMPLFDQRGARRGVLVINYKASAMLAYFRKLMAGTFGETMLLNPDGYWLSHPDEAREWGFMFGREETFAHAYPLAWRRVAVDAQGLIQNDEGWFVFSTLKYLVPAATDDASSAPGLEWKVVSRIGPQFIAFAPVRLLREHAVAVSVLMLAIAVLSVILARLRTANEQQARLLVRSEERYRQLFRFAPDGIVIADEQGRCIEVNHAGLALVGASERDLIGRPVATLFGHCDAERWSRSQTSLSEGGTRVDEWMLCQPDGAACPVEVSASLLPDGHWQGFVRDISKRRAAANEMRLAAAVFDNTEDAILITDAERRIVAVNRAYSAMSGFAAHEVIGRDPRLHRSGRHDDAFYRVMWKSLKDGGQWTGELWNRHKAGHDYPVLENISVVRDERGVITNYVAIMTDIHALKQAEQRLIELAHQDALTGLANRHVFQLKLEQSLAHARRNHQQVALLFLDLDRFKLINDTLGHEAGDQLLKVIAQRLRRSVREEDIVARLGGDEFTVVLEQIGCADNAATIAEKIIQAVSEAVTLDAGQVHTSTSIGISMFPEDARTAGDLARAADAAMYRAKSGGRQTFEFYTPELTEQATMRMSVEQGLRRALEADQLVLHYQPQVDLKSGRTCGVEALLRWQHPERGLLSPETFLPVATESGLINRVGAWVIRESCAQARRWQDANLPMVRIAINIAGHQLMYDHTVEVLTQALRDNALSTRDVLLQLEITESLLQSGEQVRATLATLRDMGFSIAIDDFGTGYSSLSHLKHLPVDTLKVDRSFMQDMPQDRDNAAIVSAIISMGHRLGMRVITEGVENEEQLAFLREHGCDEAQGFLFSPAVTPDVVAAILRDAARLIPGAMRDKSM